MVARGWTGDGGRLQLLCIPDTTPGKRRESAQSAKAKSDRDRSAAATADNNTKEKINCTATADNTKEEINCTATADNNTKEEINYAATADNNTKEKINYAATAPNGNGRNACTRHVRGQEAQQSKRGANQYIAARLSRQKQTKRYGTRTWSTTKKATYGGAVLLYRR